VAKIAGKIYIKNHGYFGNYPLNGTFLQGKIIFTKTVHQGKCHSRCWFFILATQHLKTQ
jgi:hypothetical protein